MKKNLLKKLVVPVIMTTALGISYTCNKIQESDVVKKITLHNHHQLMEKKYNSITQYMDNTEQRTITPKKGEDYGDLVLQDAKKFRIVKEMLKRNSINSLSDIYKEHNGGKDLDITQKADVPSWKE